MKYVFYVLAIVLAGLVWLNTSADGKRLKRQMSEPAAESTRLY